VSVAGEHLASSAVLRRLGQALEAAGPGDARGRPVVIGLPPGGHHELGALAFAVAARRAGLPIAYVGPDLPVADWVTATEAASAAVIGVVRSRDRQAAMDVARELRAARPALVVAFGGRSAPEDPGILQLDGPLHASVATLSRALAARPT
jgi:methanogenic corrinoid protein MtbC1